MGIPSKIPPRFGGNGKSEWKEQEQCVVWIPLQYGVPVAKIANSYSAAMVMTCKTGESTSNGAPPKVDTHFRTRLNLRLLTHVGFLRQNGLILSEVFLYMERSKNQEKNAS